MRNPWELESKEIEGQPRIVVRFTYNFELNRKIRLIEGSRYSKSLGAWHVPDILSNRLKLNMALPANDDLLKEMEQRKIIAGSGWNPNKIAEPISLFIRFLETRRYSEQTVKVYTNVVQIFLRFWHDKQPNEITSDDFAIFNHHFIIKEKLSHSYQNQFVNGIKLFYDTILNHKIDIDKIYRPRTEKKLPHVLNKDEIKKLLDALSNPKHRTMLSLIYACGLRSGECINLRIADIDSKSKRIFIRGGKGNKDRVEPIGDRTIEMLRDYYKVYRPQIYMFEGEKRGEPYSARALQMVMNSAVEKSGLGKPATLHWLRHSYATHLWESGTDIRWIKELLGHKNLKTTEIYTHISERGIGKVRSPFEDL